MVAGESNKVEISAASRTIPRGRDKTVPPLLPPTGILLAAGLSTRFGGDKLLHELPDGRAIALVSALNLQAAVEDLLVVVRPDHQALIKLLNAHHIKTLPCPNAAQGMGASLACGVAASRDTAGWLVALADMPFIDPATLRAVAKALRNGATLAAPSLDGQRNGHPVGFSAAWRDDLLKLDGDQGARSLIAARREEMTLIRCNDPGIFRDIDLPADAL
jgi:molybdenum cofactor cytidylyltransferase